MIRMLNYSSAPCIISRCHRYKQMKTPRISTSHCVKRLGIYPLLNLTHQKSEKGVHEESTQQTCISSCWTTCICTRHWAVLRSSSACSLLRCLMKHKTQTQSQATSMLVVYAPLKKHNAEAVFSSTVGKRNTLKLYKEKLNVLMCLVKIMYVICTDSSNGRKMALSLSLSVITKKYFPKPFTE